MPLFGCCVHLQARKRTGILWSFTTYVKSPNGGAHDLFGERALQLAGDTLAVGARYERSCSTGVHLATANDDSCKLAGALYIFRASGTSWIFEAYLKAPNAAPGGVFGLAAALTEHRSQSILAVSAEGEGSCTTV
jgi:hypothetical protein